MMFVYTRESMARFMVNGISCLIVSVSTLSIYGWNHLGSSLTWPS